MLRPTVLLPLGVVLVFAVAGAVQLTRDWFPYGDWAVAELVLRHVDRHFPLSGPYSAQRGYDHPLPLVYAIQWIPYQLFGQRSSAGLATTVWWNGAWLAFLVWLMARVRSPWLGVVALATVPVMAGHVPSGSLVLPWNPSLALIPALVMVFVAWRVALGSRRLLPVLVGLATWCTGAHLGFAPLAIAVSGAAAVGLVVVTVRRGGPRAWTALVRPIGLATATGLVLAAPLLVDLALNGSDSNPAHIVERGRPAPETPTVPRSELAKVLRAELAIPPAWASDTEPYNVLLLVREPRFPALLLVGVAAAVAAWMRRAHDELTGLGLSLLGVTAAVAGLANIEAGTLQPWYLLSCHAAGMAFLAFVVWSAGRSVAHVAGRWAKVEVPLPGSLRAGWHAVAPGVVAVVAAVSVVPSLHLQPHAPQVDAPTLALFDAVAERYPDGAALRVVGPIGVDGYVTQSLALQLDRAGFDVRVPDDHLYLFTRAMEAPPGWQGTDLLVRITHPGDPDAGPGAVLVASAPMEHPIIAGADSAEVWEMPRTWSPPPLPGTTDN